MCAVLQLIFLTDRTANLRTLDNKSPPLSSLTALSRALRADFSASKAVAPIPMPEENYITLPPPAKQSFKVFAVRFAVDEAAGGKDYVFFSSEIEETALNGANVFEEFQIKSASVLHVVVLVDGTAGDGFELTS